MLAFLDNRNWIPLIGKLRQRQLLFTWTLFAWMLVAPLNTFIAEAAFSLLSYEHTFNTEPWIQFRVVGCLIAGTLVVFLLYRLARRGRTCSTLVIFGLSYFAAFVAIFAIILALSLRTGFEVAERSYALNGVVAFLFSIFLGLIGIPIALFPAVPSVFLCAAICRLMMFQFFSDTHSASAAPNAKVDRTVS